MKPLRSLAILVAIATVRLAGADTLYISTYTGGVHKIAPDGTNTALFQGVQRPYGVALNSSGTLYVCADSTNRVFLRTSGGVAGSAGTAIYRDGYTAMAFDAAGNLFVGNQNQNAIVRIPRSGTSRAITTQTPFPFGLAFDADGTLHIAHTERNGFAGYVSTVNPDGTVTHVHSGLISPGGLAFDVAGNLYVAEMAGGRVLKFDPLGNRSIVATDLAFPMGLAFASDGSLLVVEQAAGTVTRLTPDGTRSTVVNGLPMPLYIAVRNDAPASLSILPPDASPAFLPEARVRLTGPLLGYFEVSASDDLVAWESLGTRQIRGGGTIELADPGANGRPARFYRSAPLW